MSPTAVRRALSGEARAVMRLASLIHRDWQPVFPRTTSQGDDVVVLVHGLFATAGVLRPLRARIEELDRTHTATFSYAPTAGVEGIARALGRLLDDVDGAARVHLVGHSMGGVAVRWFVQQVRQDRRIVQTITVAAPFDGARGARLMPGQAGRDLRAGSLVLERLRASATSVDLPHLSVFGGADSAVSASTDLGVGERLVVPDCGHNASLFHTAVADAVVERLRRHGAGASPRPGFVERRAADS